jgi:hypothetical protein
VELGVAALDQAIAQLDRVRAAALLLRDDVSNSLMAREEECRDWRRYRASDCPYQILGDYSGSARH